MFPKPTAKAVGFFVYVLEFVVVARSSYFVLVVVLVLVLFFTVFGDKF